MIDKDGYSFQVVKITLKGYEDAKQRLIHTKNFDIKGFENLKNQLLTNLQHYWKYVVAEDDKNIINSWTKMIKYQVAYQTKFLLTSHPLLNGNKRSFICLLNEIWKYYEPDNKQLKLKDPNEIITLIDNVKNETDVFKQCQKIVDFIDNHYDYDKQINQQKDDNEMTNFLNILSEM